MKRIGLLFGLVAASAIAQDGWWMQEPIRWVQTNLRETDAALDANRLVNQLADMKANVLLLGMGGITAYYPTQVEFHYPSPYLPPGHDMFGDVLKLAHAHAIRVVGRFDLSKTPKAVYDAHPEWFFRKANGDPVIYNGLYSTCINGGYYRSQGLKILAEALEKYDVDGLFFNAFGNQAADYSGHPVGLCHCDVCKRKYQQMFHKEIPDQPDDDYRKFMFISSREVAAEIGDLIHKDRPKAGYFNYIQESTDGIMSESNTAYKRALPLWPYTASDNVNRARNSEPGKMAVDLDMQFVDMPWRFATVSPFEITSRMWQNIANGGALTFEVNGTLDLQDRQALEAAKPVFRWVAAHQEYYVKEQSAARVLLLAGTASTGHTYDVRAYRGIFRLLTEQHISFAVSNNLDWIGKRPYDLVIATDWAPAALKDYAEAGGKVLIVSPHPPDFPVAPVVRTWKDIEGYVRVRNHAAYPSLKNTDLLMLAGDFTEVEGSGSNSLTLIPPSMYGPPEKIHVDMKDTDKPALLSKSMGKGEVTWIPWDLGVMYYRESLPAHSGLFHDVVAQQYPHPQLETDAHPLVEMTLMQQNGRRLLHVINLSGHSQTAYFAPFPMSNIHIRVAGQFKTAQAVRTPASLPVQTRDGYSDFTLPQLNDYELVVLN
jgi:hypothetical protein